MDALNWFFFCEGMPFNGDTIRQKALGGSETAAYYMARSLAERGHDVSMFSKCEPEGTWQGVRYRHVRYFAECVATIPHDVTVIQRIPEPFTLRFASPPVHLWWMHDLALRRAAQAVQGVLWHVTRVLTVSEWMRQQYVEVYGLPPEIVVPTRNGIDLPLIDLAPEPLVREKALVMTARPERGMDTLLEVMLPRIIKAEPDVTVYLAGYDNYVQQLQPLYQKISALVASYHGRVRHVGALSKLDLYKLYKTARAYVYPTDFSEVSCITAMECAACGLPFISSALAALPETCIPEASALIPYDEKNQGARNPAYVEAFVNTVVDVLRDPVRWKAMSDAGRAGAARYAWSGVAEEWETMVRALMPALVRMEA